MISSVLATKSRASDSVETVCFNCVPSYECHENPAVLPQITRYGFGKGPNGFCASYTGIYMIYVSHCMFVSAIYLVNYTTFP